MTAVGIADDNADTDTLRALLTLAASGVATEVVDGTEREDAAVHLGRLLGRGPGTVVLSSSGHDAPYRWPQDWERVVSDYARASNTDPTATVRRAVPA